MQNPLNPPGGGEPIDLGEVFWDGFSGLIYVALGLFVAVLAVWPLGIVTGALFALPLWAASAIFEVNTEGLENVLFAQSHGFYYYFSGPWAFIALFIFCAYLRRRCDWEPIGPDPRNHL